MAEDKNSGNKIHVGVSNIPTEQNEKIQEVVDRVVDYLSRKDGGSNFTGLSFRGSDNRSVYYTHPKEGLNNKPLSLSGDPAPVGTLDNQVAV